jgi:hypothetical protein
VEADGAVGRRTAAGIGGASDVRGVGVRRRRHGWRDGVRDRAAPGRQRREWGTILVGRRMGGHREAPGAIANASHDAAYQHFP